MKISIIIPTLNESNNLPLLLSDLSEIFEESEILIIDSLSKDKTKAISYIYGCKFYKLYKKNRGLQLNFGAKKAKGNWLLFLHADSRLKLNWSLMAYFVLTLLHPFYVVIIGALGPFSKVYWKK